MFSSVSKGMFRRPIETHKAVSDMSTQACASQKFAGPSVNISTFRARGRSPDETSQRNGLSEANTPTVLAIGGGKGGIGKSFISANLAISLARMGHQVALVDLDLGAANLHSCLGVQSPTNGIFDFVNNRVPTIEEVGVPGGVNGLTFYGGGQEFWQQIRPQSDQKARLISGLQKLDTDYVILDLGAGTHFNTLDFFIFSHAGLMVVVPEPTSIENAYVFLKSVLFRKMQSIIKMTQTEAETEGLMQSLADPHISVPPLTLISQCAQKNPEVLQPIVDLLNSTRIGFIMNQVRTKSDVEVGHSMAHISRGYFGFSAELLGSACYDDAVWKAVRGRKAVCTEFPDTLVAQNIQYISEQIVAAYAPRARLKMSS